MTVLSIENSNLSLQFVSTGQVSVLKSNETSPLWNCFVIENPTFEFDRWVFDLKELEPDDASVVSTVHWEPNWPPVPSRVHTEDGLPVSKSSLYPAVVSVTAY